MTSLRTLDASRAEAMEALCELIVPGSTRVGPVVYVDALLTNMPPPLRDEALAAIDKLAPAAAEGSDALAEHVFTAEFAMVRALAVEAFYSDFVAPGGTWMGRGRRSTSTRRLRRGWRRTGRT